MEAKINIANLLKDCPTGMELDCTMYDSVTLLNVNDREDITFPIKVLREDGNYIPLTKYGQYTYADFAKCVIFPKGETTWEGFHKPFEDGDIVISDHGDIHISKDNSSSYCCKRQNYFDATITTHVKFDRLATEEEKQKLFGAIKDNGYKWNPETKTLEKLPKFKVGDRIRSIISNSGYIYNVIEVKESLYVVSKNNEYDNKLIDFKIQDYWELVPNKFDITTLVPFESRILVRDNVDEVWLPCFFGGICNNDNKYPYRIVGGERWNCCIPYEGNQHLLGTTNDCDEYFKNW